MKKSGKTLLRSILAFVLAVTLVMGAVPFGGFVMEARADGDRITLSQAITIDDSNYSQYEGKTITGTINAWPNVGVIRINTSAPLHLTIENLNIPFETRYYVYSLVSGIALEGTTTLYLTVKGENTIKGNYGGAGICVPYGCTLEITEESTGTLNAIGGKGYGGGAGIGAKGSEMVSGQNTVCPQGLGDITIKGGTIHAEGNVVNSYGETIDSAAGIGGSGLSGCKLSDLSGCQSYEFVNNITGNIKIEGGTVTARGGKGSAGVGGGSNGTVASITITGGSVTAYSADSLVPSIGCGQNTSTSGKLTVPDVQITGGRVIADNNIGGGNNTDRFQGSDVQISDSALVSCGGNIVPGNESYCNRTFSLTVYDSTLAEDNSHVSVTLPCGIAADVEMDVEKKGVGRQVLDVIYSTTQLGQTGTVQVTIGGTTYTSGSVDLADEKHTLILGGYMYEFDGIVYDPVITAETSANFSLDPSDALLNVQIDSQDMGKLSFSGYAVSPVEITGTPALTVDIGGGISYSINATASVGEDHKGSISTDGDTLILGGYCYEFTGSVIDTHVALETTASFSLDGVSGICINGSYTPKTAGTPASGDTAATGGVASFSGYLVSSSQISEERSFTITDSGNNTYSTSVTFPEITETMAHKGRVALIMGDSASAEITYVTYMDADKTGQIQACKQITGDLWNWNAESGISWYVVTEDTTVTRRSFVTGEVNLILCDGATLDAQNGITVTTGNTLNIFVQQNGTGSLNAAGHYSGGYTRYYYAGIGGYSREIVNEPNKTVTNDCGTINIYGGSVSATAEKYAAGIGGAWESNGGTIRIFGGEITATGGENGAGIGGGSEAASGGTITILGGKITATGGKNAAGIGGGYKGSGGTITIHGGEITAEGGEEGAGIGGGEYNSGGEITIHGGEITATGGICGAGIGGGYEGSGGTITIRGGEITAIGRYYAGGRSSACIGGGGQGDGGTITITGGNVIANTDRTTGIGCGEGGNGDSPNTVISLGWTDPGDSISAVYSAGSIELTKDFVLQGSDTPATSENINGATIVPALNTGNEDTPAINGHTLLLSSEIGVQFKVTVPEGFDVTGSRMDFSVSDGKTESMDITKATKISGQNAYWFTCYINALELADTITATYHYAADGEIEGTYSALTYINTVKATWPNEEKLIALVNAIQDYGYYLQNSGWTDNLTHTSIEAATVLGAEKVESAKTGAKGYQIIRTLADSGIADVKYSLRLNEKTVINIYVAPEEDVTISSVNATAKGSCVIDGKTYYQYDTDKIAADHLGDTKTITVTTSSGMATIQVSALSYVYAILSSDSFNDAQKLAMTAYYEYFRTTQEYVASLSD